MSLDCMSDCFVPACGTLSLMTLFVPYTRTHARKSKIVQIVRGGAGSFCEDIGHLSGKYCENSFARIFYGMER